MKARATSDGYTLFGVATTWIKELEKIRPVMTHEYVHSLALSILHLPNRSEWFHEGLATQFQLKFHPQKNFPGIVRDGIGKPGHRTPLKELCSGKAIPLNRYWQAATLLEMLRSGKKYRDAVPKMIEAFQAAGSTRLDDALAKRVCGIGLETLEKDWLAHCRAKYGEE